MLSGLPLDWLGSLDERIETEGEAIKASSKPTAKLGTIPSESKEEISTELESAGTKLEGDSVANDDWHIQ